jgi:hypothetical protein
MKKILQNNKSKNSILLILILAGVSFSIVKSLFSHSFDQELQMLMREKSRTSQMEQLRAQKSEIQAQWEQKKAAFESAISQEESLNLWIKEISVFGQSQGIVFAKLEPINNEAHLERLFLSFEGDIRNFLAFVNFLIEKDPLSFIESFSMKQNENKKMDYEMTLARAISDPKKST